MLAKLTSYRFHRNSSQGSYYSKPESRKITLASCWLREDVRCISLTFLCWKVKWKYMQQSLWGAMRTQTRDNGRIDRLLFE